MDISEGCDVITPNIEANTPNPLFIKRMQKELLDNAWDKGDWNTWNPTNIEAYQEVIHHTNKLRAAIDKDDIGMILEYSADVANICEKIFTMNMNKGKQ